MKSELEQAMADFHTILSFEDPLSAMLFVNGLPLERREMLRSYAESQRIRNRQKNLRLFMVLVAILIASFFFVRF